MQKQDGKSIIKTKNSDSGSQNLEEFIKKKEAQSKVLKKILNSMKDKKSHR